MSVLLFSRLSFSRFRHKFRSPLLLRKHWLMMWTVMFFPSENLEKAALRKWKWAQILLCSWRCSWLTIGYFYTFWQKSKVWCLIMYVLYPTYWSSVFPRRCFWPCNGISSYLTMECVHTLILLARMNNMYYTGSCLLYHHLICSVNFRTKGLSVWPMKPPWRVCFARVALRLYALAPMKAVPLSLR